MAAFQRILVAVDGSEPSQAAVALAVRMAADAKGAELVFCFVIDVNDDYRVATAAETTIGGEEIVSEDRREGRRFLDEATTVAASARVTSSCEILEGDPGKTIAQRADDGHFDVIVTGTHGRNSVERFLIGSTAGSILRHAATPVLAIKK